MTTLFNSTKVQVINDFIQSVKDGELKMSFTVNRPKVESPYRGFISITGIQDHTYKVVTDFFDYMGLNHNLRVQSKDKWKKLTYSNSMLDTLYHMDVFHQWIKESMDKDPRLKTLVENLTVKQQEAPLMEVCEDLPF